MKLDDEALREAYRLQSEVFPPRADKWAGGGSAPLYHGWVIPEAFAAGVEFERKRLRSVMQAIADHKPTMNGTRCDYPCERCAEKSELARKALEGETK